MSRVLKTAGSRCKLDFPRKRLFGNFREKYIVERQHKIEDYLNKVAAATNLIGVAEACEFLQIPEGLCRLLKPTQDSSHEGQEESKARDLCATEHPQSVHVERVVDFLRRLKATTSEKQKVVQEYEDYYFSTLPSLTIPTIKLLLWGNEESGGLLDYCGDTKSYVGSGSCTRLFAKLTNCEHNAEEAEKFLDVFRMSAPTLVRKMNLGRRATTTQLHDRSGFGFLHYYLCNNTHLVAEPHDLLSNPQDLSDFTQWTRHQHLPRNIHNPKRGRTSSGHNDSLRDIADVFKEEYDDGL